MYIKKKRKSVKDWVPQRTKKASTDGSTWGQWPCVCCWNVRQLEHHLNECLIVSGTKKGGGSERSRWAALEHRKRSNRVSVYEDNTRPPHKLQKLLLLLLLAMELPPSPNHTLGPKCCESAPWWPNGRDSLNPFEWDKAQTRAKDL